MITKETIEKILVEQGLSPTDEDEVIKSALLKANLQDGDLQSALVVLRENTETHKQRVDAVQNLFRGKAKLTPAEINALLGIEVEFTPETIKASNRKMYSHLYFGQIIEIALVSFAISLVFMIGGMWFFKLGFFHNLI